MFYRPEWVPSSSPETILSKAVSAAKFCYFEVGHWISGSISTFLSSDWTNLLYRFSVNSLKIQFAKKHIIIAINVESRCNIRSTKNRHIGHPI